MGSVLVADYAWFLQPEIFSCRLCMVPSTRHFLFQLLFNIYLKAKVHAFLKSSGSFYNDFYLWTFIELWQYQLVMPQLQKGVYFHPD
jgi:hypothetical protein